ncbi:DUF1642 domain-containing protein [Lactiplantibacillus paraplantarum]|uniref:DUF1642 domain-containing protein n=1 Tax=Lactiplantibacillus paraplantarum TaxID=60520 RepID=A0AAD0TPN2_9LACO|nr:DUF1642 domain-containing protein [Lactiplantibacillus paraplantarum]AYJ39237.1 DUF1642 domain-containing protein [Lactiplantibacillus paraplantarum]GEO61083.1 hypothetical protein LPA07_14040 [Lactiplantibacillus paraplantarum]
MIKVYRKTATIKAEQFDGSDEMVDKYELIDAGTMLGTHHSPEVYLTGSGKLCVGDWIATDIDGERWLIADAIFKQTYAELPVIPKEVAGYLEIVRQEETLFGVLDEALAGVSDLSLWIAENQDDFARAWLDGYVVEGKHD